MPKPLRRSPKIIGVVGSRRRDTDNDFSLCFEACKTIYKEGDKFVSGGCPQGGDRFAEIIAKQLGATITIHYPNWTTYGKSAGFVRNTLIAEDCDILLALPHEDRSGGTEDTIKKAINLNKRVLIVMDNGEVVEESHA